MRRRFVTLGGAAVAALAAAAGRGRADHAPVPSPPDFVFVGIETVAAGSFGPEVVTGYWHVFDVTSHGGLDWVEGHGGNAFKLWRRKDSNGASAFQWVNTSFSSSTVGTHVGQRQSTFRIRATPR